ncbi:MAG: DEAD/DEAH box helicase family protein, partial [Candidatus Poseidoniaceae archaeon]
MVDDWDDDGSFEARANLDVGEVDLQERDPFDLSRALEGASMEHLRPEVSRFVLHSEHAPAGDQPEAIEQLVQQIEGGQERCVLLGVTGSGKTFAMANVIERLNLPTLIMSHNKTLARQLHHELAGYFPENAVEYFVSHYDYYQPEAYLPKRDLYIDKELSINERIEQERFSAVASLVSRPDCVIVSSVSCIYGLNPPETFLEHHLRVHVGQFLPRRGCPSPMNASCVRATLRRVSTRCAMTVDGRPGAQRGVECLPLPEVRTAWFAQRTRAHRRSVVPGS